MWLINGNPPTDDNEVEVVIRSFRFVPPGPVLPAQLTQARWADGLFHFDLTGQTDWWYEVQCSTNLRDWLCADTILATNAAFTFTDTNAAQTSSAARYYRALTLP